MLVQHGFPVMLRWLSIPCQTWHANRYVMLRESEKKNDLPIVRRKKFCRFIPFVVIYHLFYRHISLKLCALGYISLFSCISIYIYIISHVLVFEKLHSRQLFENNGIDRWRHVMAFRESQTIKNEKRLKMSNMSCWFIHKVE